jgi:predicted aldo/keto reductase-like oxidoreductase
MKTVRLGRTGLQVTRVGFGGIPIQRLSEEEAVRVVRRCLELGVRFVDTANSYTTSEERVGKALAASGLSREQVVIATKTAARDRNTAWEHLELSLRRLDVDYVDLWQMHNVSTVAAYEEVLGPGGAWEAAEQALEEGRTRHVGITSHSMDIALEAVPSGLFETVQFPFNFVTNEPADRLVPLALQHDVGFIAMKPFGGGMLANANLAIKYLLQFDHVVPDPGIERVEQIEEIATIVAGPWDLAPAEWQEIASIRQAVGVRFCRRCGYCEPCPEGVRISLVMNLPNLLRRMPRERFVSGRLAEAAQTGRHCIECGECEEKCPYMLPIREMLVEHTELYERAMR